MVFNIMVRVRYSFGSRHTGKLKNIKKQRGKYPDVMKGVVDISDIVLEVLDSRFVEETRNEALEKRLKKSGKKVVFVLNKADLVNVASVKKKLKKDMTPVVFVSTKTGIGSRNLRERIRIEASRIKLDEKIIKGDFEDRKKKGMSANTQIRKKVHVGIVGYPNVGKSSLINLITRRGVAKTSKQAGFTKGMQKIRLTDKILILDTPGVIPESKYSSYSKKAFSRDAMLGARSHSDVKNPEDVVNFLMGEHSDEIEKYYKIDVGGSTDDLIEKVGKEKNFLEKGGKIDIDRTSRLIIRDWQSGAMKK